LRGLEEREGEGGTHLVSGTATAGRKRQFRGIRLSVAKGEERLGKKGRRGEGACPGGKCETQQSGQEGRWTRIIPTICRNAEGPKDGKGSQEGIFCTPESHASTVRGEGTVFLFPKEKRAHEGKTGCASWQGRLKSTNGDLRKEK